MSAAPATSRLAGAIRIAVAVVLGGIGAAAGFTHTHDWAAHHGQTGWLAWADAVVIEGIAIVAGFELHRDHHRRHHTRRVSFPLVVLVAGFGVQMTAQVADAEPSAAGWLLAAMPALGFLTVVKLLMRRIPTAPASEEAPTPEPEPSTPDTPAPAIRPEPVQRPELTPSPATSVPAEPSPSSPPETPRHPARPFRMRLPAPMREQITAVVATARREGRELTTADIRAAVKVPQHLAEQILADLTPA